jgi:hypothetical protein
MKRPREMFIAVIIFLILSSACAYGDTWTPAKNLSNNKCIAIAPTIAVDGPNIYVVWSACRPANLYRQIYFKKSVDGGVTWTTKKRLTNNAGDSQYPTIAVDGPDIYVVWMDYAPGNFEIYFKKSNDGGVTWTANKRLTNNAGDSEVPAIAVDGPNIYVVWMDYAPGNFEIYFKKSVDGGATWTTKRLTWNANDSSAPVIAVSGPNIYVVWEDTTEIYFKKSVDGGATWTTKRRLTYTGGTSASPAITVDGSNIYVVWSGNYEIYFKKSVDAGATWTTKRLTWNAGDSQYPAIAVDVSNIYVVWQDYNPVNDEIYFKKSDDGGVTWTTKKRLSWNRGRSYSPAIAVNGSNIYVVWEDNTPGNWEIYFKKGVLD